MKKLVSIVLVIVVLVTGCLAFTGCGKKDTISIAVPNDPTNEGRALLILQELGYIKLSADAGITATKLDIVENPYNIEFREVEAAQLVNVLPDVDYAIINSNYAIDAGYHPATDSIAIEGAYSPYGNIISVKQGNENLPAIKALVAAVSSQKVKTFIESTYNGDVACILENPTNGFDSSVDYAALNGTKISVAASPTPHAEILEIAKETLAEKGIELDIKIFTDYVQPNNVVESGEIDANYFQHVPYMEDFNSQNGTHIVSVAAIHVEPMGIYSKQHKTLEDIKG